MKLLSLGIVVMIITVQCRHREPDYITIFPGKPEVPSSVKKEHEHLLGQIRPLTLLQDSTGIAAGKLYALMEFHFKEEEDYVLPPLGILPLLASGKMPEQHKEIILLTEKLRNRMAIMSAEHQKTKAHMEELKRLAGKEILPEILETEKRLHAHAALEEEILFPAVLFIGDYLGQVSK